MRNNFVDFSFSLLHFSKFGALLCSFARKTHVLCSEDASKKLVDSACLTSFEHVEAATRGIAQERLSRVE